jgi:hypothetical protein
MSASAGDFHPMLENSRKPCGKRVERRWIEQETRHHDEWHDDQQSIDPIPNGWRHFPHAANINGFAIGLFNVGICSVSDDIDGMERLAAGLLSFK